MRSPIPLDELLGFVEPTTRTAIVECKSFYPSRKLDTLSRDAHNYYLGMFKDSSDVQNLIYYGWLMTEIGTIFKRALEKWKAASVESSRKSRQVSHFEKRVRLSYFEAWKIFTHSEVRDHTIYAHQLVREFSPLLDIDEVVNYYNRLLFPKKVPKEELIALI